MVASLVNSKKAWKVVPLRRSLARNMLILRWWIQNPTHLSTLMRGIDKKTRRCHVVKSPGWTRRDADLNNIARVRILECNKQQRSAGLDSKTKSQRPFFCVEDMFSICRNCQAQKARRRSRWPEERGGGGLLLFATNFLFDAAKMTGAQQQKTSLIPSCVNKSLLSSDCSTSSKWGWGGRDRKSEEERKTTGSTLKGGQSDLLSETAKEEKKHVFRGYPTGLSSKF